MREIVYYQVLTNYGPVRLGEDVNDLVRLGWQPLGGVTVSKDTSMNLIYAQAVVQYKEQVTDK